MHSGQITALRDATMPATWSSVLSQKAQTSGMLSVARAVGSVRLIFGAAACSESTSRTSTTSPADNAAASQRASATGCCSGTTEPAISSQPSFRSGYSDTVALITSALASPATTRRSPLTFTSRQITAAPTNFPLRAAVYSSALRIPVRRQFPGGQKGELRIAETALRQCPARAVHLRGIDIDATRRRLAKHTGIRIHPCLDAFRRQHLRKGVCRWHVGDRDQQLPGGH